MKVIYSGWNNREFMIAYEKYIYDKLGFGEPDIPVSYTHLTLPTTPYV